MNRPFIWYNIMVIVLFRFVTMHAFDRQTDAHGKTALHTMQRDKKVTEVYNNYGLSADRWTSGRQEH